MNQFSELICCFFICSPATYDILRISLIYLNCDEQEAGKVPRGSNQKFKLYRLAQIMMEQTDDEHYITMPEIIEELAKYAGVPVWNGLTNEFHPTQMLADMLTVREHLEHVIY